MRVRVRVRVWVRVRVRVRVVAALLEPERISLRDIELALDCAGAEQLRRLVTVRVRARARVRFRARVSVRVRVGARVSVKIRVRVRVSSCGASSELWFGSKGSVVSASPPLVRAGALSKVRRTRVSSRPCYSILG